MVMVTDVVMLKKMFFFTEMGNEKFAPDFFLLPSLVETTDSVVVFWEDRDPQYSKKCSILRTFYTYSSAPEF